MVLIATTLDQGQVRIIQGPVAVKNITFMQIETPGYPLKFILQHRGKIVLEMVGREVIIENDSVSRLTTRAINEAKVHIQLSKEGLRKMTGSRYARGRIIAASGYIRRVKHTPLWKVESQYDDSKFYNVILQDDGLA